MSAVIAFALNLLLLSTLAIGVLVAATIAWEYLSEWWQERAAAKRRQEREAQEFNVSLRRMQAAFWAAREQLRRENDRR